MKTLVISLLLVGACHIEENLGFSVVGEPRWAISLGGGGEDRGMLAAVDSIGDVVVCGDFTGPADFGSGLENTGGPWAFITKRVASDGAERWTKRLLGLSSMSHVWIGAIAITPQDEVVVTGSYIGSVDFDGQTLTLEEPEPPDHGDMFLAKYASDGQLLWVRGLADHSNAGGTALAVDASGAIYATAVFNRGTLVLDGEVYREIDGDPDTVLLVYDSDGTRRWHHVMQAASGPFSRSVALAPNGDVLVGGHFGAPASLGGAIIHPDARVRGFLTRFRSDGLYLESHAVGPAAPYASWGPDVRVDSAGRIVLQQVEVDESAGAPSNQGSTLRVLEDDGDELWASAIANHGRYSPQGRMLLTTHDGLIASAAWTDNPMTVTGGMEVVTFEADGSNAVTSFGDRISDDNRSATLVFGADVSTTGAIAFAGHFGGTVDFGTGPLTTRGKTDIFIVVVDPPVAAP